jgi:hypothetical protein
VSASKSINNNSNDRKRKEGSYERDCSQKCNDNRKKSCEHRYHADHFKDEPNERPLDKNKKNSEKEENYSSPFSWPFNRIEEIESAIKANEEGESQEEEDVSCILDNF